MRRELDKRIRWRGVLGFLAGALISPLAVNWISKYINQPRFEVSVGLARELNWTLFGAYPDGDIILSRTDSWDVFGECMLAQTAELEVAKIDSMLPQESNMVSTIVVTNVGGSEATNVSLALQIDSVGTTIDAKVEAAMRARIERDSSRPSQIRGTQEDISNSFILTVERWPAGLSAIISVQQRYEHAWQDTIPSKSAPIVGVEQLYLISSERGRELVPMARVPVLQALAKAAVTGVLVHGTTRRRGYTGRALVDITFPFEKVGADIGPNACHVPASVPYR